jgi:hypothetical protein
MRTMYRRCAHAGCAAPAGGGRCQDCGKSFCADHVAATDFSGIRHEGARATAWTRFVCHACAGLTNRTLLAASARLARDRARRDERGYWWEQRRP